MIPRGRLRGEQGIDRSELPGPDGLANVVRKQMVEVFVLLRTGRGARLVLRMKNPILCSVHGE